MLEISENRIVGRKTSKYKLCKCFICCKMNMRIYKLLYLTTGMENRAKDIFCDLFFYCLQVRVVVWIFDLVTVDKDKLGFSEFARSDGNWYLIYLVG